MGSLSDFVSGGGVTPYFEEFLSSGTWTKPDGVSFVYVEAVGGGGGGENQNFGNESGGGGGGEFGFTLLLASDVGASETVTVGAGGLGGETGVVENGTDGGASSFGSHLTAIGGNAGASGYGGSAPRSQKNTFDPTPENRAIAEHCTFPMGSFGAGGLFADGGDSYYGGAGGGSGSTASAPPGTSVLGGDGGVGGFLPDTAAGDGATPGGGGGGAREGAAGGGDGGSGRVRVWAW